MIVAWLSWYLGPYLKVKAANLATHEDIQKLVDQVRETEIVKADISDRMWHRQAVWQYKREFYFETFKILSDMWTALADRATAEENSKTEKQKVFWAELKVTAAEAYVDNLKQFIHQMHMAKVIMSHESAEILETMYHRFKETSSEEQREKAKVVVDAIEALQRTGKRDLGLDNGVADRLASEA